MNQLAATTYRPWSRPTEAAVVVGFWLMLGALFLLRRALVLPPGVALATPSVVLTLVEYLLWAGLTPVIFLMARRLPLERGVWGRRLALHLVIALAVAIAIELLRRFALPALLFPDLPGPRRFGRPVGPLGVIVGFRFLDAFVVAMAIYAAGFARDYFLRYRERGAEAARLEAQLAAARLQALRMQLNPHFLFNTLHAVSALVERDPDGVRRIVARLSGLLRHALEDDTAQEIPLRQELPFVRGYLEIQQIRFQDRLEVYEDFSEDALEALVPPLILQPLLENAVEHGVSHREDGTGRVTIAARRSANDLVLGVRDNGPAHGLPPSDAAGVGLRNTRARLDALYGSAAGLELAPAPGGGLIAEIRLPYHTAADLHVASS